MPIVRQSTAPDQCTGQEAVLPRSGNCDLASLLRGAQRIFEGKDAEGDRRTLRILCCFSGQECTPTALMEAANNEYRLDAWVRGARFTGHGGGGQLPDGKAWARERVRRKNIFFAGQFRNRGP